VAIAVLNTDRELVNVLSSVIEDMGQVPDGTTDKDRFLEVIDPKVHPIAIIDDCFRDVIEGTKQVYPEIEIVVTGDGDGEEFINIGATYYLKKPFKVQALEEVLGVLLSRPVSSENSSQKNLVYADPKMKRIVDMLNKVAPTQAPVFIQGESGTGKEVIARYIHAHSKRNKGPFVGINLAAIPETLVESELFGYEKGAFTGAYTARVGKFEQADGGTILLDEIGEMPPSLQAKLLRVLQERQIDRIGSKTSTPVDFRVIATTNRDIDASIRDGSFREDLFFRLNVIPIEVPPLRNRKEDIIPLAEHFIGIVAAREGVPRKTLSKGTKKLLLEYHWPGNVRELENVMERAMILTDGAEISEDDIMIDKRSSSQGDLYPASGMTISEMERRLIISTLDSVSWNRTKAAELLGISIRTLRNKLNEYKEKGQIYDDQEKGKLQHISG